MTPLLSAPSLVSGGISCQIKPCPQVLTPENPTPPVANGCHQHDCVGVSWVTNPSVPGTVHAPQAMGTRSEGHRVLQEGLGLRSGAEDRDRVICAWTTLLPSTSDRFAFSLLQFPLFPKALLAMVVAVIVSSVFDPLTGTQIHGLAAR